MYLEEIAEASSQGHIVSAVKENSVWNKLSYFHVTDNTCCDIMHDIFLGVAKYNIPKILNYFIYVKKCFTLDAFNCRKQLFDYGSTDLQNISSPITKTQIKNVNIKMNASQMKLFLETILLLIGDLVDENDIVYKYLINFIKIVHIILLDEFDNDILKLLQDLIFEHNKSYVTIFEEQLKPKYHFLTHYPTVIKK